MARPAAIVPVSAESESYNWLIYSEPGVGKTVLAGTAPNALIVRPPTDNIESAALSNSTAQQWVVEDHESLIEVYEYLRHEQHGFKWVWLDTITLFQELGLHSIMEDISSAKPHRKLWAPDRPEYGENMNRLSIWIRNMKALPVNFGVMAHCVRTEDFEGREIYMPAIQGKGMPEKICGYMGVVGHLMAYTKDGTIVRRLTTDKTSKYYAKDVYSAFGGRILNPTIPKMVAMVEAKKAGVRPKPVKKAVAKKAIARKVT